MNAELVELTQWIRYDSQTGEFARLKKHRCTDSDRADIKGSARGYRVVNIKSKSYYAHRLAWLFFYGDWPKFEIDHINGKPDDNRIENLRQATREENCGNVVKRPGHVGLFGVTTQKNTSRFRSSISVNAKRKHIGYFDTPMEAHLAALQALDKYRGEFSPAGRIREAA